STKTRRLQSSAIKVSTRALVISMTPRFAFDNRSLGGDTVDLKSLPEEIAKRNIKELATIPIQVKYESATCGNLTIIDTPGFGSFEPDDQQSTEIEKMVTELAKPSHR